MSAKNCSGTLSKGPRSDVQWRRSKTRQPAPVMDWWRSQNLSRIVATSVSTRRYETEPVSARPSSSFEAREGRTGDHDSPWTAAQLRSLYEAQTSTVPSKDDFWIAVAGQVVGKDAQECQQKWFENFASPSGLVRPTISTTATRAGKKKAGGKDRSAGKQGEAKPFDFGSPTPTNGVRSDNDDLFHATPLRGQSRLALQSGGCQVAEVGRGTPKTPCGPSTQQHGRTPMWALDAEDRYASTKIKPDQRRGVSKAYVQAVSKKMRKTFGASKEGSVRGQATALGVGRKINAVDNLEGHALKVSISESGTVMATLDGDEDDIFGGDEGDSSDDDDE